VRSARGCRLEYFDGFVASASALKASQQ